MKYFLLLCVFFVSTQCFSLDRNSFTFIRYDLEVRIEPAQQRMGVRGKVTLRNDSGVPQKNAVLQISSSLDWRSIQMDGKPLQFVSQVYTSDIDHTGGLSEAIVSLRREIAPQGIVELEIGYEGTIALDATRLTRMGVPEDRAPHSDWDQISAAFTAVRGIGYVAWYPVATLSANLSEGASVFETVGNWKQKEVGAVMRVVLQVDGTTQGPAPMLVQNAAKCLDASSGRTPGSANDCTYEQLDRVVPAFVIAGYSALRTSAADIGYLDDHRASAQNYAAAADQAVPVVVDWFGTPHQPIQLFEFADPVAAPFETGKMLLAPFHGSDPKLAQILLVHQLTHSAIYSQRAWIYEGLATFAQALMREQQAARPAALDYLGLHRSALADAEKTISQEKDSSTAHSLISTADDEFYRSKAMFVWWMLRDVVGEPVLKKAIASYRADDDKQPAYVQHLVEAQSHRDLEWFFDDWVYRDRGLPDFRIASAYPRQILNGGYLVTVTVENLGGAGAEVPVTIRTESGDVSQRLEVRGKSSATVRIEAPSLPGEVTVNDGSVPESDISNNSFAVAKPTKKD